MNRDKAGLGKQADEIPECLNSLSLSQCLLSKCFQVTVTSAASDVFIACSIRLSFGIADTQWGQYSKLRRVLTGFDSLIQDQTIDKKQFHVTKFKYLAAEVSVLHSWGYDLWVISK